MDQETVTAIPRLNELAGVVCPSCLLSNHPASPFCADCGAPIGNYAAIDPIQRIYAGGFACRSAVTGPPKVIILVGMWLIFSPLLVIEYYCLTSEIHILEKIIYLGAFLISAAILFRVTLNFIAKRLAPQQEEIKDEV